MDSIRRDHRIAEAEAVARLRRLQPDQGTSEKIGLSALRLAQRVRAAPPGPHTATLLGNKLPEESASKD